MALTVHFIDESWTLKSYLLDFIEQGEDLSAVAEKERIMESLQNFGIENKIFSVTTDNASVAVAATRDIGRYHIRCMAHVLNIALKNGFNELQSKNIIEKLSKFSFSIKNSRK